MLPFFYKRCTCCGRVVPDSKPDLGQCALCRVEQALLDGPPDGWLARRNVSPRPDQYEVWRIVWQLDLEARNPATFCEHEKDWLANNSAPAVGARTPRKKKAA